MYKILIVEDDVKLNQAVCAYLTDNNFIVTGCLNAREAYDQLYNAQYDLIVSDIMMPEIDGFEFSETVRELNHHIPIILVTAKEDLNSKQRGFEKGIDDYMVKPISLAELVMRIHALLRRANINSEKN